MFKYTFILAAFCLCLISCRQEETILDEPTTTTEPPKDLEGAFYSGEIRDTEGNPVSARISVFQSDELIGTVQSDEQGAYSTAGLSLEVGPEVTFGIEEITFNNKYKRYDSDEVIYENEDLTLVPKAQNSYGYDTSLRNPGSSDLVRVYGTFTDANGDPLANASAMIMYNIIQISSDTIRLNGSFDQTDENGYVEFLVPNDEFLYFHSRFSSELSIGCLRNINVVDNTELFYGIGLQEIGVITEDFEIIEQEGLIYNPSNYLISGNLLECDGSPVREGKVRMRFSFLADGEPRIYYLETTEFSEEGEFSFDLNFCSDSGIIQVDLTALSASGLGAERNFSLNSSVHLAPIETCDEGLVQLESFMTIEVGDDYVFENIKFINPEMMAPFSFNQGGSHILAGLVGISIPSLGLGDNPVFTLQLDALGDPKKPFAFTAEQGEVTAHVSEITENEIIGTLSGEVMTESLGVQTIGGSFIIRYQ